MKSSKPFIPTTPLVKTSAGSPQALDVDALVSYLEHDAQPMIVLDPEYRILAANTAYQRQFGVASQPHVGRKCYQVSHHYDVPYDQAGEHCPMKRAFELRGPDRVLHIHHTPRGPEHVDVELRPIFNAQQEVMAYVERLSTVRGASARPSAEGLVGRSTAFNAAISALHRVAPSMLPVLLLGESGTGKELFARAVHEASERAQHPFVVVDCSGITETLFESELFGYEKGAFTGAAARKPGLVETAQGGTLFLDEIGDVSLSMQVKLLRLIESGTFRRVGGIETIRADFRLLAATHQPVQEMISNGRFRQDLYYRISAFPIHLPAVRERPDDIALLVDSILQRIGSAQDAAGAIAGRLLADDGVIRIEHLPGDMAAGMTAHRESEAAPTSLSARGELTDRELVRLVEGFSGTRGALAAYLGMSERTLYRRLKTLR